MGWFKDRGKAATIVGYLLWAATAHMHVSNAVHKPIEVRNSFLKGAITMGFWPEYEAYSKAGIKNAFWKGIWNFNIWPMCEAYDKGGMKYPFWKMIPTLGIWPASEAAYHNGVHNPGWKAVATTRIWSSIEAHHRLELREAYKEGRLEEELGKTKLQEEMNVYLNLKGDAKYDCLLEAPREK